MANGVNGFGRMQEIGGRTRTDGSLNDTYIPAMYQEQRDTVTLTSTQKSKPTLLDRFKSIFHIKPQHQKLERNGQPLSKTEIEEFINQHFGYDDDDNDEITLKDETLNKLKNSKFEAFVKYYTNPDPILCKKFNSVSKDMIKEVMNSCDGKYTNDFKNNPISFYMFCCFMNSCMISDDFKALDENLKTAIIEGTFPIENFTKKELDSVLAYKTHSNDINGILSNKKNEESLTANGVDKKFIKENIKNINTLTQILQSATIPNDVQVYRSEGTGILSRGIDSISLDGIDGKKTPGEWINDVNDLLTEAKADKTSESYKKASEIIDKLNAAYADNVLTATQERFMSTSIEKSGAEGFLHNDGMAWEIKLPEGSHALYVDTLDREQSFGNEHEIVVQRNSELIASNFKIEKRDKETPYRNTFFVMVEARIKTPDECPKDIKK